MKMTEKMKQEIEEYMKKEGIELSDEELDEVSGGRGLTRNERREALNHTHVEMKRTAGYVQYIQSLPEGSPEVSFRKFTHGVGLDFTITYKCRSCGATVTAPVNGDDPICSGCGRKMFLRDMMEIIHDAL